MKTSARPRFGKGIKLRHDLDGNAILLVPESALQLNASAAAALELVDGERTVAQIVEAVVERFDVNATEAEREIGGLFDRLAERGFVE